MLFDIHYHCYTLCERWITQSSPDTCYAVNAKRVVNARARIDNKVELSMSQTTASTDSQLAVELSGDSTIKRSCTCIDLVGSEVSKWADWGPSLVMDVHYLDVINTLMDGGKSDRFLNPHWLGAMSTPLYNNQSFNGNEPQEKGFACEQEGRVGDTNIIPHNTPQKHVFSGYRHGNLGGSRQRGRA